jgi:flagellar biosynthesis/type III secretory pathway chaperone
MTPDKAMQTIDTGAGGPDPSTDESPPAAVFEPIAAALDAEDELCGHLLAVLQREKQALVGADPVRLGEITREKEALLLKWRGIEEQRSRALAEAAGALGIDGPPPDLSALRRHAPAAVERRLAASGEALAGRMSAVASLIRSNGRLVNHGLSLVRGSIRLLDQLSTPHSVYQKSGRMTRGTGGGRMLSGRV